MNSLKKKKKKIRLKKKKIRLKKKKIKLTKIRRKKITLILIMLVKMMKTGFK